MMNVQYFINRDGMALNSINNTARAQTLNILFLFGTSKIYQYGLT